MPLFRKKPVVEAKRDDPLTYTLPMIIKSQSVPEISEALGLKTSFTAHKTPISAAAPVQFHRPTGWRPSVDITADKRKSIASLYGKAGTAATTPSTATHKLPPMPKRSTRQYPHFNLIVAGAAATGKTSYIKTLLATSDIASNNAAEVKEAVARFGCRRNGQLKQTIDNESITLEVHENERIVLTVQDTPGFDLHPSDELAADAIINDIIKSIECKYLASLQAESQVVRTSTKTALDSHTHLVLYFLHPASFMTTARRSNALSRRNTKKSIKSLSKSKSSPTLRDRKDSNRSLSSPPSSVGHGSITIRGDQDEIDEIGMHPLDIKLIKKLSKRVNVLPILSRADELTLTRLAENREAVARDFRRHSLTYGVLQYEDNGQAQANASPVDSIPQVPSTPETALVNGHTLATPVSSTMSKSHSAPELACNASEEIDNRPRAVRTRSRSFSKRRTLAELHLDPPTPSTAGLQKSLPFAVIAPELLPAQQFQNVPLTRVYPWGKIDCLSPKHSDFALARSTILGTYMKEFRDSTRAHYEEYRTERLLVAKRSTMQPSHHQERILKEIANL